MTVCCVVGCSVRSKHKGAENGMHRFPRDPKIRRKWLLAIKRANWMPSPYSVVCGNHFEQHCLITTDKRVLLHPKAVPTIFPSYPKCYQNWNQFESEHLAEIYSAENIKSENESDYEHIQDPNSNQVADSESDHNSNSGAGHSHCSSENAQQLEELRDAVSKLTNTVLRKGLCYFKNKRKNEYMKAQVEEQLKEIAELEETVNLLKKTSPYI